MNPFTPPVECARTFVPPFHHLVARPLPCVLDEPGFEVRTGFHFDGDRSATVVLPSTFGYPDPIWDHREELRGTVGCVSRYWVPCLVRKITPRANALWEDAVPQPSEVRILKLHRLPYETLLEKLHGVPNPAPFVDALEAGDYTQAEYDEAVRFAEANPWIVEPRDVLDLKDGCDIEITITGERMKTRVHFEVLPGSMAIGCKDHEALETAMRTFDPADYVPFNRHRYATLTEKVLKR